MDRLTRAEVIHIVGQIDDVKLAEIIATGATLEELEEAVAWATGSSRVGEDLERPLAGVVGTIYDILTADEEYGEERE
ncbi:MAG: hypothetical protein ACE5LF_09575 [Alphaproteobacteria bacterium]